MATNQFFHSNYYSNDEQSLVDSLMVEAIQQQGYDAFYMPREKVNFDYLFGEDALSEFKKNYQLEVYIDSATEFGGESKMLSKLGLDIRDELTLQISISRFANAITTHEPQIIRPREGDLIYFEIFNESIFEISFVENKSPFYQLGELYLYRVNLKRLVYGSQTIQAEHNDGINSINKLGAITEIVLGQDIGFQSFIPNEVVYQLNPDNTTYRASGTVVSFEDNILRVHDVFGTFQEGINILGEDSQANYTFPVKDNTTFDDTSANKIADNINVDTEMEGITNTDEINPFLEF